MKVKILTNGISKGKFLLNWPDKVDITRSLKSLKHEKVQSSVGNHNVARSNMII